jgi:hypothetical protein
MKLIPPRAHGLLDYAAAALLICSPWLFGFAGDQPESKIPLFLGVFTLVYSLLTRYDYGAIYWLSFRTHLVIDFLSGVFLATSPWLFHFSDRVYMPHLLMGVAEIIVVILSDPIIRTQTTDKAHISQKYN